MNSLFYNRETSRRNAIKSKHNNKIQDITSLNCFICNNKKYEITCLICKKKTCLNCSNNNFCLYCNIKEENKHLIETYINSCKEENRESKQVEIVKYKKTNYCCCY
jgi:hypothetical protein